MSEFHDLSERLLNRESGGETCWGNFGYWAEATHYPAACEALAEQLAHAAGLDETSRVFDAGFGAGDQLLCWLKQFNVAQLSGANISESQTQLARTRLTAAGRSDLAMNLACSDATDGLRKLADEPKHSARRPNRIVALDCAYHFDNRRSFLGAAAGAISPGGTVATTDIILGDGLFRRRERLAIALMARISKIPTANLVCESDYRQQWQDTGFEIRYFGDITSNVFEPFGQWLALYKKSIDVSAPATRWLKYDLTAHFLKWAAQQQLLRYVVCVGKGSRACGQKPY